MLFINCIFSYIFSAMVRNLIKKIPIVGNVVIRLKKQFFPRFKFKTTEQYWVDRYKKGGNSGAGSYSKLCGFKAEVLNGFVKDNDVKTVMELGCGDGNQLTYFDFPDYVGYDVSSLIVEQCKKMFSGDPSKSFFTMSDYTLDKFDLTLSLDVVYHLVEDDIFNTYLTQLFESSKRFVIIYSSNEEDVGDTDSHVRHRKFTDWIDNHQPNFELIEVIPNKYPRKDIKGPETSFADFYIFEIKGK